MVKKKKRSLLYFITELSPKVTDWTWKTDEILKVGVSTNEEYLRGKRLTCNTDIFALKMFISSVSKFMKMNNE